MIRRPSDLFPIPSLLNEYRRLCAMPQFPIQLNTSEDETSTEFSCRGIYASGLWHLCKSGVDYAGLIPILRWIKEGPKIVDITAEQYEALARVEIRLEAKDYQMPYPTVLINLPPGKLNECVILHRMELQWRSGKKPVIIACSMSRSHLNDIVTVIRQREGIEVEESLALYEKSVTEEEGLSAKLGVRVSMNMMLAMVNYGCQAAYIFPKEVEMEQKFIEKGNRPSREGRTASDRLRDQPQIVVLDRNVKLYHREGAKEPGEKTGKEKCFHWRRGHWRKWKSKLIFVRPCMVRADLLEVDRSETTTRYKKEDKHG